MEYHLYIVETSQSHGGHEDHLRTEYVLADSPGSALLHAAPRMIDVHEVKWPDTCTGNYLESLDDRYHMTCGRLDEECRDGYGVDDQDAEDAISDIYSVMLGVICQLVPLRSRPKSFDKLYTEG